MQHTQSQSPDAARMQTIGWMLLLTLWVGVCVVYPALTAPPPQDDDTSEEAGASEEAGDDENVSTEDGEVEPDNGDPVGDVRPDTGDDNGSSTDGDDASADGTEAGDGSAEGTDGGDSTDGSGDEGTEPGTDDGASESTATNEGEGDGEATPDTVGDDADGNPQTAPQGALQSTSALTQAMVESALRVYPAELEAADLNTDPGTLFPGTAPEAEVSDRPDAKGVQPGEESVRIRFTEYGAAVYDYMVFGYQGQVGRDHAELENLTRNTRLLAPFDPDNLHFTTHLPLPGLTDYLRRARWTWLPNEATTEEVTDEETGATRTMHRAAFEIVVRYRINDTRYHLQVRKTYSWERGSYQLSVEHSIRNLGAEALPIRNGRVVGPMGMEAGYFRPDDKDVIVMHVNGSSDRPTKLIRVPFGEGAEPQEDQIEPGYKEQSLVQFFGRGFEQFDPQQRPTNVQQFRVTGGPSDSNIVAWAGHSLRFYSGVIFGPTVTSVDEDGAPTARVRASGVVYEPFRLENPAAMPELEADEARNFWFMKNWLSLDAIRIEPGETVTFSHEAYVGPKEPEELTSAGLEETIHYSYSWVEWLARPLLDLMGFFHGLVGNWGIAIILLTIVVRFVLFPLSYQSQLKMQESSALMQRVKPKIDKLRKKYEGNRQKLQQEQIKLFREEGVPMTGMLQGCLLMFLQMPIWIALFGAFRYSIDFYGANFLWINDLTKPDALFTIAITRFPDVPILDMFGLFGNMTPSGVFHLNILPILVIITMYTQMKWMQNQQSATMDPDQASQQKLMMGCMYVFFFFFFYTMPAGFNLYFFASTGYALLENRILRPRVKQKIEERHPGIYEQIERERERAKIEAEREKKKASK